MEIPYKGRTKVQKNNDYESYLVSCLLGYFGKIALTLFNAALSAWSLVPCRTSCICLGRINQRTAPGDGRNYWKNIMMMKMAIWELGWIWEMNIQISSILSRDSLQSLWDHRFGIWNVRRDHVQILNSNFFEIEVPSIDILLPDLFFLLGNFYPPHLSKNSLWVRRRVNINCLVINKCCSFCGPLQ